MRYLVYFAATVALAFASEVLDFTEDFDDKIDDHGLILVEFFAPWCGHCKKLAPQYDEASITLMKNDPPVALAKVDCTADGGKDACAKFDVSGYPTLKIFRDGKFAEDFNGQRTADDIVKVMKGKAGPTSKLVESIKDAEKFLKTTEYAVFAFVESMDNELATTFKKAADALSSEFKFGITTSKDVQDKYGYTDDIVLFQPSHLHSKFEESKLKFTDDPTVYKLKNWISANTLGLCGHRTPGNQANFKQPLVMVYYDVDYDKNVKGTNYWRNRVMKVGKKFLDAGKTISFSVNDNEDFAHEIGEYGLTSGDKPTVALKNQKGQKFAMKEEFSMETFEGFLKDFFDDKLEPYMKSEAVPEPNDDPVKVVVAKNFDDIVNNEDKDVLIEFYAPWCGHCKSLAPKYDELATKLIDEPEITIAKMDATANDVPPQYEVRGFPTIYWSPKGSKNAPITYQGGREVDEFFKYLAKEATNELQGYDRSGKPKGDKKKKKTEL